MDWNNDGKKDLISGDTKGQVWVFLNTGSDQAPELAAGVRVEAGGKTIIASRHVGDKEGPMGTYSKLHYADFDGDGLRDLLIGHDRSRGSEVVMYRNTGTQEEPKFSGPKVLDLPGPNMSRPSPYVIDFDRDGKQDLLFGTEEQGEVYFFKNTGTNEQPQLARGERLALEGGDFHRGYRCRIDVTDWNGDGKLDLLVGNFYSHNKPVGGNIWLFLGM